MTNQSIRIHDLSTNEVIDREMTDEEVSELAAQANQAQAQRDAVEAEEVTKLAAKEAVLAKLGLTAEEAAALLA
jgi:hypothetical protein